MARRKAGVLASQKQARSSGNASTVDSIKKDFRSAPRGSSVRARVQLKSGGSVYKTFSKGANGRITVGATSDGA